MIVFKYAIRAVCYAIVALCFVAILPVFAPLYLIAWAFDYEDI